MKVGPLTAQTEVAIAAIAKAIRDKAEEHAGEAAAHALMGRYRQAYEHEVRRDECVAIANAVQKALAVSSRRKRGGR